MAAKRIYEIAKEYKVSSEAMMAIIKKLNIPVKSHMATASEELLAAIALHFEKEKDRVKQDYAAKRQKALERQKVVPPPPPPVPLTVPEPAKAVPGAAPAKTPPPPKAPGQPAPPPPRPVYRPIESFRPRSQRDTRRRPFDRPVDQNAVQASFRRTMAELGTHRKSRRSFHREETPEAVTVEPAKKVRVNEYMTVGELALAMQLRPAQVIAKCLELGLLASINQRLDLDTIQTLALEFGFETDQVKEIGVEESAQEEEGELLPRPPVVTIMGHVDHGKTSLLDYIRKSNVIAGESGGITQHIGAYEVELPGGKITFLDTPGHQAFTAMRARGAQITDIVVLVVAADDSVMPQTVEAIDHARAAGVPIIVAINKIDLPTARPEQIRQQLSKYNLVPEEWGGKTIMVDISAKIGKNIERLLEMILLQAELLELKAAPFQRGSGIIVESQLDRGKGPVTTVLVQKGTLRVGDPFVCGQYHGRVRALLNERGHPGEFAGPSTPVQVLGAAGVPQAGDSFFVTADEQKAREIAGKRQQVKREQEFHRIQSITLSDVYQKVKAGQMQELRVIIKADVDGSAEVLADTLEKIGSSEVKVTVIHRGVGAINESDVLLAVASQAIIIGFHVRPELRARELAARERIDIRLYTIIYEVEQEIKKALEGMLAPEKSEQVNATLEVRQLFKVPKAGVVAGSYVQSGTVKRTDRIRVLRDGMAVYDGVIGSLKRFKDDVREVPAGYECGLRVENFNDLKVGDTLETYEITEVARKLE